MTFLHPALLGIGLACIAIPIIIHLLMHRRRKPVMWGAMRFLLEAYRRQRRKMMLEKWLLLACRCLLLALLALAIGRPLLGRLASGKPGKTVYVLIDNGMASGLRDAAGTTALARHKQVAKQVLASLRSLAGAGTEADRVGLIALGGPAEGLVVPASANLGSVESLIDAIEPTDSRTDFPGGLGLLTGALNPAEGSGQAAPRADRTFVVLLSDYLDGSLDVSAGADASGGPGAGAGALGGVKLPDGVRLISSSPLPAGAGGATANVSITGLEPLRSVLVDAAKTPGASADLSEIVRVQLRRTGDASQAAATTVRARIVAAEGGDANAVESPTERAVVHWSPGQETAWAPVPVRTDKRLGAGANKGAASAVVVGSIDDDALPADNRARRPVELRDALRVGVVAPIRFGKAERIDKLDPASWTRLALAPAGESTGVDAIDIEPASLDAARLAALDAVVLPRPDLVPEGAWARLRVFIDSGGLVLVCPPPGVTVHLWGDAMTKGLGLDWTVAREPSDESGKRVRRGAAVGAEGAGGGAGGGGGQSSSLLSIVEGELDDLLAPVSVRKALPMMAAPEGGEALLRLDDGTMLMWAGTIGAKPAASAATAGVSKPEETSGRGLLVYLGVAMDLEWSDLPAKPLMVPLVQEVLRQGVGRARGTWTSVAGARPAVPSRTTELQELVDPARGSAERGALGRVRVDANGLAEPVRRAGLWRAVDERGQVRGLVAVNPDPRAGRTNVQPKDAVAGVLNKIVPGRGGVGSSAEGAAAADAIVWLPPASPDRSLPGVRAGPSVSEAVAAVFGRVDSGSPISWPLLIAALVLALAEIVLARRASHADVSPLEGAGVGGAGAVSIAPSQKEAA